MPEGLENLILGVQPIGISAAGELCSPNRDAPVARRQRTAAGEAVWVPSGGFGQSGRASASRRGGRVRGKRSPARSGSARCRAGAACAVRCRGRFGRGPRSGPGGGDAVRGRRACGVPEQGHLR
jgi:hypothetical protein